MIKNELTSTVKEPKLTRRPESSHLYFIYIINVNKLCRLAPNAMAPPANCLFCLKRYRGKWNIGILDPAFKEWLNQAWKIIAPEQQSQRHLKHEHGRNYVMKYRKDRSDIMKPESGETLALFAFPLSNKTAIIFNISAKTGSILADFFIIYESIKICVINNRLYLVTLWCFAATSMG